MVAENKNKWDYLEKNEIEYTEYKVKPKWTIKIAD